MSAYSDLVVVLDRVAAALRVAGVPWFVTGSLASSVHGELRDTNDVEIVAGIERDGLSAILEPLASDFVFDIDEASAAVADGRSFNLIHRKTYLKVDVFPCDTPFERERARRAEPLKLEGASEALLVTTREDILLAKLRWYRLGGESSTTQRRDIERLVELNRGEFDSPYVRQWAAVLGVEDLLRRFDPLTAG